MFFWTKKRRVVTRGRVELPVQDHVLDRYLNLTVLLPGGGTENLFSHFVSQEGADYHPVRASRLRVGQVATVQILLRTAVVQGSCRIVALPGARGCGRIEWDLGAEDRERLERFLVSARRNVAV